MSNTIFDASGNPVGTFSGSSSGMTQSGSFPTGAGRSQNGPMTQPGQGMGFNGMRPGGSGMLGASAGFNQMQVPGSGMRQPGMQPSFGGRQPTTGPFRNGNIAGQLGGNPNAFGMGMSSLNGVGAANGQMSRNSFALNNNGVPVNRNIQPFSGIVPPQPSTTLSNPDAGTAGTNVVANGGTAWGTSTGNSALNTNNAFGTNASTNTANASFNGNNALNSANSALSTNTALNSNTALNTNALNSGMSNGAASAGASSSIFSNTANANSGVSSFSSFSGKR